MKKKKLLLFVILPAVALISLGGGVLVAYLSAPPPVAEPNQAAAQAAVEQIPELGLGAAKPVSSAAEQQRRATQNRLTQDLKDLMSDMNAKRQEYERKIMELRSEEARLAQVREVANEDLKRLDDMRIDIANAVANLKKEKQALEANKIRVKKDENANLKVMAGVLAEMKPANAADMLFSMSNRPAGPEGDARAGIDEAALYIFLMDPKKRPKVFDELIRGKNQDLAATLMKKVKHIELEQ